MDPRSIAIISIFTIACGTFLIATVLKYLLRRTPAAGTKQLEEIAQRLARLEQNVDAIAVETERISEGQRFTTKLLSDKSTARSIAQ